MSVIFNNVSWTHVTVQTTIGNNPVGQDNPQGPQLSLDQGQQSDPIAFPVFLFWRRDANPDAPNGEWTPWMQEFATWDRTVDL